MSQAFFAGHSLAHANGDQPDCQICLQASGGSAALTTVDSGPLMPVCTAQPCFRPVVSVPLPVLANAHPVRAPPSQPV